MTGPDRDALERHASHRTLRGIPTTVVNTRPDVDTGDVFQRLDAALGLIETHTPHYFRHIRRDFAGLQVERYACRGAYFPVQRICLVELTFIVNRGFSLAQVASTIVHEGMHARLHARGIEAESRAREERFCRRAEIEFGSLAPGGEPVVERALAAMAGSDDEVAPVIDPVLARRRIAEVDRAAAVPRWLREALGRHGNA
ncbi:MAG TPA: hypothetical protein VFT04_14625 [Gemmatimonadales bacterium]|nr:hypothetical protein [Gemmatimonadales bacterium]